MLREARGYLIPVLHDEWIGDHHGGRARERTVKGTLWPLVSRQLQQQTKIRRTFRVGSSQFSLLFPYLYKNTSNAHVAFS